MHSKVFIVLFTFVFKLFWVSLFSDILLIEVPFSRWFFKHHWTSYSQNEQ